MGRIINPNLKQLVKSYKDPTKKGCIMQGGSRSGKTWSSIDFIVLLCSNYLDGGTIHIIKETYNSFKTTLFDDFKRRLPMYGIHDSPFGKIQNITQYNLLGVELFFIGADSQTKALGSGSDLFWMNEPLTISKDIFDQKEMRCRRFWWADFNPMYSRHYFYEIGARRDEIDLIETTQIDNPKTSENEKAKILGYEPTEENKLRGTADKYKWEVYGLGKKGKREGVVFKEWEMVKEIPEAANLIGYGLDFGYSNDPTALIAVYEFNHELYFDELIYTTGLKNDQIAKRIIDLGISRNDVIYAESAEPKSIDEIYAYDINIKATVKGKDSIQNGINIIDQRKLNITERSVNLIDEFENYIYDKDKKDRTLNKPIDDFNHGIDAIRYLALMKLTKTKPVKIEVSSTTDKSKTLEMADILNEAF